MPLHSSSGRWRLGLTLALLTSVLWGVLPIALAVTLQALDIYTVTWFRFLVAFGLLTVFLATRRQLPTWERLRASSFSLLAIATLCLGLNYLFFLQGLAQTSPSSAEILIQLAPVLFGLGAIAVFKERYILRQWLGMVVLIVGFILFFYQQLQVLVTSPTNYLIGSGIMVLASVTWAIYALAQKQLLQTLPSASIMLIVYGGCTLIFTFLAAPQKLLTLSPIHLGMLLFCGLNTLLAYSAFAEALEHWEASKVSAVLAVTPIFTLISMWAVSYFMPNLIASERITPLGLVGAILVVAGSVAISLGRNYRT